MSDYITVDQLRSYIGDSTNLLDDVLSMAVTAASRRINTICGRTFNLATATSDKFFSPDSWWTCELRDTAGQRWDLANTTGLAVHVDQGYNGSYGVTFTNGTDFYLDPINQTQFGYSPWPYQRLIGLSNSGSAFPIPVAGCAPTVKITGTWGWATVPDDVVQATLMLAAAVFKRKDAPFGIAGQGDFGAIRVRNDPMVNEMLEPFVDMSRVIA